MSPLFNKFDMSIIGYNKVILLIGNRNSRRQSLVMDYLNQHTEFESGIIVSPTNEYQSFNVRNF